MDTLNTMTLQQFESSLSGDTPPKDITIALAAMWYDGKGDWEQAHLTAQDIPTTDGSWVHAYLHRKEGDGWNANYWYNRAGRSMPDYPLDKEWKEMVQSFLGRTSL
ncbi:MAG TPA: hypothetical protein VGM31_18865 [Puia sp.]